ncbi:MAG: MFS transporter [archaeon]
MSRVPDLCSTYQRKYGDSSDAAGPRMKQIQSLRQNFSNTSVQLLILVSLALSYWLANYVIQPTLPLYILELGGTKLELGIILSISSITVILTRIPIGLVSDRIGRWNLLSLALILTSASGFLYLIVDSAAWLYPLRALQGIALSIFPPIGLAIASSLAREGQRGRTLGIYLTGVAICMMIGPAINSLLIEHGGYSLIFMTAGLIPLAGLSICAVARATRLIQEPHTLSSKEKKLASSSEGPPSSLKSLVLSKPIAAISLARACFSTTDGMFLTLFAVYAVQDLSISPSMIGLLFSVKGLANTLARSPAGILCDRVGVKKPAVAAYLLTALAFAVLSEVRTIGLIALALLMIDTAWGIRVVAEWVLIGDSAGPNSSAMAMSYLATMFDFGEMVGALLAGFLAAFLPTSWIFRIAALIVVGGTIPLAIVKIGNGRGSAT